MVIKTAWRWHKTDTDRWNRTGDPDTSTGNYSYLSSDKEKTVSSATCAEKARFQHEGKHEYRKGQVGERRGSSNVRVGWGG